MVFPVAVGVAASLQTPEGYKPQAAKVDLLSLEPHATVLNQIFKDRPTMSAQPLNFRGGGSGQLVSTVKRPETTITENNIPIYCPDSQLDFGQVSQGFLVYSAVQTLFFPETH